MDRLRYGICLGLVLTLAAAALFGSPFGQKLEEQYGLALLFALRGPRPPPEGVVIVNLDHGPAAGLGLAGDFSTWPRTVHARVIDRLKRCGARVIAFDVHFVEARRPEDDRAFADALRRAGNVILFEGIKRQSDTPPARAAAAEPLAVDRLVPPLPLFADAALALAPFPIPKRPIRINQTWLFKQSAGEVPTLPVVALKAMVRRHDGYLQALIARQAQGTNAAAEATAKAGTAAAGLVTAIDAGRDLFRHSPGLAAAVVAAIADDAAALPAPADRAVLQALVRVYAGNDSIHINYYGPPATLPTLTYADILAAPEADLARLQHQLQDRVVFIGAARTTWSGQKDGFYTVYSQPDGLDLSGVELAATVYANLLDHSQLTPVAPALGLALLALAGLGAGLVSVLLPPLSAAGALIGLGGAWLAAASSCFGRQALWLPVVIPLALQFPAALVAAIVGGYVRACRERRNVGKALGLYLPANVVTELTRDPAFIDSGGRMVYGACLLTDAQRYTALSETLPPAGLSRLMNEYFDHLFRPVTARGGQVCNVIGDSMLALWPSAEPRLEPREQACRAALQMITAIDGFNRRHPDTPLATRIGLHYGQLLIGNIGAASHFEYAPIGDIVNTASRIEGLNKLLGTRVLASAAALDGVTGIVSRRLGVFLLEGKSQPITIDEVVTVAEGDGPLQTAVAQVFAAALSDFQHRRWTSAIDGFEHCLALFGDDGPSRFYLRLSRSCLEQPPPEDWQGIVRVGK